MIDLGDKDKVNLLHDMLDQLNLGEMPPKKKEVKVEKKEVKNYIDSVFATQGYLNRIKRINLINSVIDQKIQEAVETGIYSKKDLLDWMKHLQEVETSLKPKTQGPQVAVQINNYDKLMKDLMEWPLTTGLS